MDYYFLLRFGHFLGFILLGGGLLAVFISEFQAYRARDIDTFAEAARYTAVFYDALVVPGALLLALSGYFLIRELGMGFLDQPWLIAMWALFLFEFIEGNTITRIQFRKTLMLSREARSGAMELDHKLRAEARSIVGRIAHFLDLPLFLVIVYCGTARPDSWAQILTAMFIAMSVAVVLLIMMPRLERFPT